LLPKRKRPRVVALLYVMLLLGMVIERSSFGWLLARFQPENCLIRVIQGAAVVTMALNLIALWKQERAIPSDAAT
jgi:BCD family chlorophyll transporter-like MFS transporter